MCIFIALPPFPYLHLHKFIPPSFLFAICNFIQSHGLYFTSCPYKYFTQFISKSIFAQLCHFKNHSYHLILFPSSSYHVTLFFPSSLSIYRYQQSQTLQSFSYMYKSLTCPVLVSNSIYMFYFNSHSSCSSLYIQPHLNTIISSPFPSSISFYSPVQNYLKSLQPNIYQCSSLT